MTLLTSENWRERAVHMDLSMQLYSMDYLAHANFYKSYNPSYDIIQALTNETNWAYYLHSACMQ